MKPVVIFLLAFSLCLGLSWAVTPHTVVFTDNLVSDFAADEMVYADSSTDSAWSGLDELYKLYLTWDSSTLYLGVDAMRTQNETIDIWIGGAGISNIVNLQTVTLNKRLITNSWHPELAVHDDSTAVVLASILMDGNFSWLDSSAGTLICYSNQSGILEVALPWGTVGLTPNRVMQIAATITGPGWGGCDAMPDQGTQPNGDGVADVLSDWLQIQVTDSGSNPLSGISPSSLQTVPVELSSFQAD
jgi:hypothetical protein